MTGPLAQQIAHLWAYVAPEPRDSHVRAALSVIERHVHDMETALRREFFRLLPDLDYEEIIPGSDNEDGTDPVFDWAWARHPWFALLGLTRDEIHDWFDQQNRAALPASGTRNPRNRVAREKGTE